MRTSQIIIALSSTLVFFACDRSKPDIHQSTLQAANPRAEAQASKLEPAPQLLAPTPKSAGSELSKVALTPALTEYVKKVIPMMARISEARKLELKKLARFIEAKAKNGEPANLTFICTHNSRRSHLSQLWSATAAAYYGIANVKTFSGGTEATAFNPRAVAAVERAGFKVTKGEGDNPHYQVTFSEGAPAQECFSKKYSDSSNPQTNFAAVMTCSKADESCPIVEGAVVRVAIPYVDPKVSDGSPQEASTYDQRTAQIASEMFYLFSQVHS